MIATNLSLGSNKPQKRLTSMCIRLGKARKMGQERGKVLFPAKGEERKGKAKILVGVRQAFIEGTTSSLGPMKGNWGPAWRNEENLYTLEITGEHWGGREKIKIPKFVSGLRRPRNAHEINEPRQEGAHEPNNREKKKIVYER